MRLHNFLVGQRVDPPNADDLNGFATGTLEFMRDFPEIQVGILNANDGTEHPDGRGRLTRIEEESRRVGVELRIH